MGDAELEVGWLLAAVGQEEGDHVVALVRVRILVLVVSVRG